MIYIHTCIACKYVCTHAQPIAVGASCNLILQSQSSWSLCNGTWQKRHSELGNRLSLQSGEMTRPMQQAVFVLFICAYQQKWYMNIYVCIHICTNICIRIYIHTYIYILIYVCRNVWIKLDIDIWIQTCMRVYIHVYISEYTCTCTNKYVFTYAGIKHIHRFVHMCS